MPRDWPAEGGQSLTRADSCRQCHDPHRKSEQRSRGDGGLLGGHGEGDSWKKESVNNGAGDVVGWEKQKTRAQNKDRWKQCDPQGGASKSQARRQE